MLSLPPFSWPRPPATERMGQGGTKSSLSPLTLRRSTQSRIEAWGKASSGGKVISCSFERWVNCGSAADCGFHDLADYFTRREDFRATGFLLKPDVTNGRYIRVRRHGRTRLNLEEKRSGIKISVEIEPCFTSGILKRKVLQRDQRYLITNFIQLHFNKDGVAIVGCQGNLAVVQVLDRTSSYVPEFYFIDLQRQISLGKFACELAEPLWYECYISPDRSRIVLRPDVNGQMWLPGEVLTTHTVNKIQVMVMSKFPDSGGHVLAFDNRHGCRYMFRAKGKDLELFDFEDMVVTKSAHSLELPASIRQIKSSPSGTFLALRCAYPQYSMEFLTNTVVILRADTISILFSVDARGPFWPVSEVVNQQVFPRFSACETGVAVMRNKTSKRKVAVYKLPAFCASLQHFTRRTIRCYVSYSNLFKLQLPKKLIQYLRYEQ